MFAKASIPDAHETQKPGVTVDAPCRPSDFRSCKAAPERIREQSRAQSAIAALHQLHLIRDAAFAASKHPVTVPSF